MKLSEIRPCDKCGGPIAPIFQVVRMSIAVFDPAAVNQTLGIHRMFGGKALRLAEAMSPQPECVTVGSDKEPELETLLLLCQSCYCDDINLAVLAEKVTDQHSGEPQL